MSAFQKTIQETVSFKTQHIQEKGALEGCILDHCSYFLHEQH